MTQINALERDIPQGYKLDHAGRLVHESSIREIDKLRDDLVYDIVKRAKFMSDALAEFKQKAMRDIDAFANLSAERYGVNLGGKKGNITLISFDGKYKVIRSISEYIKFDEGLNAAYELIEKCINKWTAETADPNFRTLLDMAFMRDKEGNVKTHRIMGLLRYDFKDKVDKTKSDEDWLTAKKAISESIMQTGSKQYIRVYKRNDTTEKYEPINLSVSND